MKYWKCSKTKRVLYKRSINILSYQNVFFKHFLRVTGQCEVCQLSKNPEVRILNKPSKHNGKIMVLEINHHSERANYFAKKVAENFPDRIVVSMDLCQRLQTNQFNHWLDYSQVKLYCVSY